MQKRARPLPRNDLFDEAFHYPAETEEEARSLLEDGTEDARGRARALGFFMSTPMEDEDDQVRVLAELITWFVVNHPNDHICSFPSFRSLPGAGPAHAERVESLWHEHERAGRLDQTGYQNAGAVFAQSDWREAERLFLLGRSTEGADASRAAIMLGKLRAALATAGADGDVAEHAAAAVDYLADLADSEDVDHGTRGSRGYARQMSAEMCVLAGRLDDAARFARLLIEEDEEPHGLGQHVGHTVLGRVALLRGDTAAARDELRRAGDTRRDGVSSTHGPRLALAKALLETGERDAVVAYLRKRAESWTHDRGRTTEWIAAIEAGAEPDWDRQRDHV